ncbi:hypothetical protein E5082_03525 [Streptomyces griseoluteus]|uniref:Uncharacterized protein n=1 Tax=Streptomyces griseoluteus TaxID=29306 RepID=A0A4Z1DRF1_STRGP|nr:DUF6308 family protein [Streptomyces griseoluteus]TGN87480.1 hypothetical protein E5082_03525 [Streptomyces griseoluteus]GHF12366.1 hypothetical protein GCM10017776_32720 [Streptomyces griseoluteus]
MLKIPSALWDRAYVAELLRRYWAVFPNGAPAYTGSRFERFAGGGDRPEVANHFTAADFIAVAALSVDVPVRAILRVLETTEPNPFNSLLLRIPSGIELAESEEQQIAEDGPAWKLWWSLRRIDGVGPVGAGKLLARKRPHLLPVYDSVIKKVFERPSMDLQFWSHMRFALRANGYALVAHLDDVRGLAGIGKDISVLRILDTAAWLHGKDSGIGT